MSESATRRSETGLEEMFGRDGFVAVPGRYMMFFEPGLLRPGERVLQRRRLQALSGPAGDWSAAADLLISAMVGVDPIPRARTPFGSESASRRS